MIASHFIFSIVLVTVFSALVFAEINEPVAQQVRLVRAEVTFAPETQRAVRPKFINDMLGDNGGPTMVAKQPMPTVAKVPTATEATSPKVGGGVPLGGGIPMFPPGAGGLGGQGAGVQNGWGHYNEFNFPTRLDRPRAFGINEASSLSIPAVWLIGCISLLSMLFL